MIKEDKDTEKTAFLNEIATVKVENIYQEYRDPQQQQEKKEAVQEEETSMYPILKINDKITSKQNVVV